MRIRTMELPTVVVGEFTQSPYLLVIDRCQCNDLDDVRLQNIDGLKEATGARGVLVFAASVEIGSQYDA